MLGQVIGGLPINPQFVYGSNGSFGSFGSCFNGYVECGDDKVSSKHINPSIPVTEQHKNIIIKNKENSHESFCKSR